MVMLLQNFDNLKVVMKISRLRKFLWRFGLVCLVLIVAIESLLYFRPLPTLQPVVSLKSPLPAPAPTLPWPAYGQAAIGAQGFGVLATHGTQKSAPIASVAKTMTAYCVLKEKPLAAGQQGPMLTITDQDVATYNDYVAKGGSVAQVAAGEQISEYQALQAMLLPSANNFADLLADWAFGSMENYIAYANQQAKDLGMSDTHIADASGFSSQTTASAQDLVRLGQAAIQNPVIAAVVSQPQATIPVAGSVHNVNWLLGTDGVNGIKTGDTDQAGGCFLFSAPRTVGSQTVTIVGAIMSAPRLDAAISDSKPLLAAASQNFKVQTVVKTGQSVGYYQLPWGGQVPAVAKQDLSLLIWADQKMQVSAKLNPIHAPELTGATVGSVTASANGKSTATQAILIQKIPTPNWKWRIFER